MVSSSKREEMDKFVLRLVFITHIFLTLKLPSDYLYNFTTIAGRFMVVFGMIGLMMFYDVYASMLLGLVLVFSTIEYKNRTKGSQFGCRILTKQSKK